MRKLTVEKIQKSQKTYFNFREINTRSGNVYFVCRNHGTLFQSDNVKNHSLSCDSLHVAYLNEMLECLLPRPGCPLRSQSQCWIFIGLSCLLIVALKPRNKN